MKNMIILLLVVLSLCLQGCFLTKIATVPMRVGGALLSVLPVVGNGMDASIDLAADTVDEIPL